MHQPRRGPVMAFEFNRQAYDGAKAPHIWVYPSSVADRCDHSQNPAWRFLLHVLGTAGEFERSIIRDRTQAGTLALPAGLQGRQSGEDRLQPVRKNLLIGRPRRMFSRERVLELRTEGRSYHEIAATLGIGEATVRRVLQAVNNATEPRQELTPTVL